MQWLPSFNLILAVFATVATLGGAVYAWRYQNRSALRCTRTQRAPRIGRGLAFERLPDGILLADDKGVIIDLNLAAETILGITQVSALGVEYQTLLHPHSLAPAAQPGDDLPGELEIADGVATRWYSIRVLPVGAHGDNVGSIVVLHDETERRVAAQQEQATRAEQEAVLRQKSEFLSVISHEIRSPMHAVIGMTGMLLETELNSEQKDFVGTIRASGDSMLAIVNNVLDFSKIEAGQIELEHLPIDIESCLENTLEIFAGEAAKKNIELTYTIEDGAPTRILGDVTRLRQVLTNLVSNAVKFTDHGEIALRVAAENESPPLLHIQVQDSGIGIAPDQMHRLFHSFSQAEASTTRRYGGTGLGLAISKRLCEIMGGAIWVESRPGVGTTFHFTIAAPPAPDGLPASGPPSALAGRRILVVDDHASTRGMIRRILCDFGVNVSEADSGWSALEQIETSGNFDAALIDLHMPGMDGESLVHRLSAEHSLARPRLVILVSLTDSSVRNRAAELGLAACIMKPVKRAQLRNTLGDIFPGVRFTPQPAAGDDFAAPRAAPLKLDLLLADDNLVGRRVTQAVLRRLGYDVDMAGNGLDVLAALEIRRYDVVLMDVYMPDMDGLETTQRIRAEVAAERQPYIIALTASALAQDRERCLDAGMDDFLAKPVSINSLNEALHRAAASASPTETH